MKKPNDRKTRHLTVREKRFRRHERKLTPHTRMTEKQRRFLNAKLAGANNRQAALMAGYSEKDPDGSAQQAIKSIRAKGLDVYEVLGLTREQFIQKHLAPCLKATEVKVFANRGKVVYSKPLIAWGPRLKAIDLTFLIAGEYKAEQQNTAPGVRVVILDRAHRPQRLPDRVEERTLPALGEPEVESNREPREFKSSLR